jgi:hypothetical protein
MLVPMPCNSWPDVLVSLSPALSGLLSATALLVASRARTTSKDAQQTSQAALSISLVQPDSHPPSGSGKAAPGRKKS